MEIQDITSSATPENTYSFDFRGQATEYFKIWIVNIFLTIITLGIYSAWAKVRNTKYIYGNTFLNDASFDYTANPVAILKGRVIAVTVLAIYVIGTEIMPATGILFGVLFLLAMPWLVLRSMQFRLRNTTYRNIRFNFNGDYGEAVAVFVGLALLTPFTLGMLYPYVVFRRNQYIVANSSYGKTKFDFDAKSGLFYSTYVIAGLILIASFVIFSMTFGSVMNTTNPDNPVNMQYASLAPFLFMAIYLLLYVFIDTRVKNIIWNHVYFPEFRFLSTLKLSNMLWIYLTNLIAIALTLGLAIPWAKIRTVRYRLEQLKLSGVNDLESFISDKVGSVSATGEGISDVLDVDFGL